MNSLEVEVELKTLTSVLLLGSIALTFNKLLILKYSIIYGCSCTYFMFAMSLPYFLFYIKAYASLFANNFLNSLLFKECPALKAFT